MDYNYVKNAILKAYWYQKHIIKNSEIIVNKSVKLMFNLRMRKRCILTDGVIIEKEIQTLKNLAILIEEYKGECISMLTQCVLCFVIVDKIKIRLINQLHLVWFSSLEMLFVLIM